MSEYELNPGFKCPNCERELKQVLTAPRLLFKTKPFEAFWSPVDGSIINNEHELKEHNKRNGVVPLHDGYDEAGVQNLTKRDYQKELDAVQSKDMRNDIDKAVEKLEQGYVPAKQYEE